MDEIANSRRGQGWPPCADYHTGSPAAASDAGAAVCQTRPAPPVQTGMPLAKASELHESRPHLHGGACASHSANLATLHSMKVSELALRTGVSAHRLRRYEDLGLIRAERTGAGYRAFAERAVREVTFIAMSRDLGFSLKEIGESLPRYRAGTLTFDQLIEIMRDRIDDVDRQIAEQRGLRRKLVSHIAWLEKQKRAFEKRKHDTPPPLGPHHESPHDEARWLPAPHATQPAHRSLGTAVGARDG